MTTYEHAAQDALECSMDAHGYAVPAPIVWDFLHSVSRDSDREVYAYMATMPDSVPFGFRYAYARLIAGEPQ